MAERFNSPLARQYKLETKQLFAIGQDSVASTDISAQKIAPYLRTAQPSYMLNADNQTMVQLSKPKKPEKSIQSRIFEPIMEKEPFLDRSKSIIDSKVTHSDQMHINVLYISLLGMISGQIAVDPEFSEAIMRRSAALLFGEASIAYFIADSNLRFADSKLYENGQHYVDAGKLVNYVLTPESFYSILANRGVPTVDIHDFVHHAAQFRTWPEFFVPFFNMQYIVQKALKDSDSKEKTELFMLKKLLTFISFATAEYSVVGEKVDQNYSFGCLLYQYPRKSPMKNIDLLKGNITPREFTNWNSLRALMSLKRRDLEASHHFSDKKCDWLEELGYRLPTEYWPQLDDSGEVVLEPIANLSRSHRIHFKKLAFPSNPRELFENATELIAHTVDSKTLKISSKTKQELEEWLHVMSEG